MIQPIQVPVTGVCFIQKTTRVYEKKGRQEKEAGAEGLEPSSQGFGGPHVTLHHTPVYVNQLLFVEPLGIEPSQWLRSDLN